VKVINENISIFQQLFLLVQCHPSSADDVTLRRVLICTQQLAAVKFN